MGARTRPRLFLAGLLALLFAVSCAPPPAADATAHPTATAPAATPTTPQPTATALTGLLPVLRVVDGDTLEVRLNGRKETVRVIGIDTPESVDPRKPVQCFGREASARAKALLEGQSVRLIEDPTQGERDKYRRIIRYVEMADGSDFGLTMIRDGYAHEYTYDDPYQRREAYIAAHAQARASAVGFWAAETCNGDTKQPATTPIRKPSPTRTPKPGATATPTPAR